MKCRLDFVTNSSSANFLIALKGGITQEQKIAVADAVLEKALGQVISVEEAKEISGRDMMKRIDRVMANGMQLRGGCLSFEDDMASYGYADIFKLIWDALEANGDGNFEQLDTELYY